jgi:hypothetical protein
MLEISKFIFDQCSHLHAIVDIQFLNSHRPFIDTILTYYKIYDFQYATTLFNKKINSFHYQKPYGIWKIPYCIITSISIFMIRRVLRMSQM